jgi:hypothetical protein
MLSIINDEDKTAALAIFITKAGLSIEKGRQILEIYRGHISDALQMARNNGRLMNENIFLYN